MNGQLSSEGPMGKTTLKTMPPVPACRDFKGTVRACARVAALWALRLRWGGALAGRPQDDQGGDAVLSDLGVCFGRRRVCCCGLNNQPLFAAAATT
jgi:hypothetical protein